MKHETYIVESKGVMPQWDRDGSYWTLEQARRALPYFERNRYRTYRIVRVIREVIERQQADNTPTLPAEVLDRLPAGA